MGNMATMGRNVLETRGANGRLARLTGIIAVQKTITVEAFFKVETHDFGNEYR